MTPRLKEHTRCKKVGILWGDVLKRLPRNYFKKLLNGGERRFTSHRNGNQRFPEVHFNLLQQLGLTTAQRFTGLKHFLSEALAENME